MRIDGDRIGVGHRSQIFRRSRNRRRQRAVRAVDVKPEIEFAADRRDLRQRIDRAGADRSGRADDQERTVAALAVCGDLTAKLGRVHPLMLVDWNPADRVGSQPEEVGRFLNPGVRLRRRVRRAAAARSPQRPVLRTSQSAFAVRAARKQTKFAMLPPLTSSPPPQLARRTA